MTTFLGVLEPVRFAQLRQTIGYQLANRLIARIASRVLDSVPGATLARTGRTTVEFLFPAADRAAARMVMAAAQDALRRPVEIAGLELSIEPSIGFARAEAGIITDELIDRVRTALATAHADHPRLVFADAVAGGVGPVGDIELLRGLRQALAEGKAQLHYQPKLSTRSGRIEAAEALFRWAPADGGTVSIERLMTLVEGTGMIRDLTLWVLDRAIADAATLAARGHRLTLFVNISGPLIADGGFVADVIARTRAAGAAIGLEITETAVIDDPDVAIDNLRLLADAGIRVAIDDYGSGLSSLAYLKQLPVQELKIDRLFIAGLTESNRDPLIVRSSIDLAHALDMEVTAEGVDNAMTLALLRVMGCDMVQGFHIAPALPMPELTVFLDETARTADIDGPALPVWPQLARAK